jgi:hypothetical protein
MPEKKIPRKKASMGTEVVSAFCLVCGHSIPANRVTERIKGQSTETVPYFDSITFDPKQPFGMVRTATGKNSFSDWHYINPKDAPDLFQAMKNRFLTALGEWVDKGWITKGEVERMLK